MSYPLLVATTSSVATIIVDQASVNKGTTITPDAQSIPHKSSGVITCATALWNGEGDALIGFQTGEVERIDSEGVSKGIIYAFDEPVVAIIQKETNVVFVGTENKISTVNIDNGDLLDSEINVCPNFCPESAGGDVAQPLQKAPSKLKALDFCADKGLLSIMTENVILLHYLSTSTQVSMNLQRLSSPPSGAIFHPHKAGKMVVFGGSQVVIYDTAKPSVPIRVVPLSAREPIVDVAFLSGVESKNTLVVATSYGEVYSIDFDKTRPIVSKLDLQELPCKISCLSNGKLIIGTRAGRVLIQAGDSFSPLWSSDRQIIALEPSRASPLSPNAAKPGVNIGNITTRKPTLPTKPVATRATKAIPLRAHPIEAPSDRKETNGAPRAKRIPSGASERVRSPTTTRSVSGDTGNSVLGSAKEGVKPLPSAASSPKSTRTPPSKLSSTTPASSPRFNTNIPRQVESPTSSRGGRSLPHHPGERTPSPDLPGVSDISAIYPVKGTPGMKTPSVADDDDDITIGTTPAHTARSSRASDIEQSSKVRPSMQKENQRGMPNKVGHIRNASNGDRRGTLKPNSQQVGNVKRTPLRNALANDSLQLSPMRTPARTPVRQSIEAKEFIRDVVKEAMREREEEQRDELRALHLDVVKMGRLWKTELRDLMEEYIGDFKALQEENQRLRAENDRLRRGY
ncbi:hypothetical protein FRC17_004241 [Serendipita sp. 399]|nr:hypothetical protein FRC17_004241 [Serendipita sp. 399]